MLLQSDVFVWNEQFERLERAELAALQLKQLRAELERAAAAVPFHAERLHKAGVSGQSLSSLEDLRRLPLTSKSDWRDHYPLELRIIHGLHQRLGLTAVVQVLDAGSLPRSEGKAMHVLDTRNLGQEQP